MATDKTFTVCGVSTSTDGTKVRFANDSMRVKVLAKNGHTDIMLIELPEAMTKLAAVAFIADLPEFSGDGAQEAISEYNLRHAPKAPRAPKEPKAAKVEVKPAKAAKPAKAKAEPAAEKVDADLSDMEDAPF